MPKGARVAVVLSLVVVVAWPGFRATRAFDQDRHAAEAAAVLSAPDVVTYQLSPAAPAPADGREPAGTAGSTAASGRLSYRPRIWLSVVDLQGLA